MDNPNPNEMTITLNARFVLASIVILAILIGILGGYVIFSRTSGPVGHSPSGQQVFLRPEGQALISGVLCPCGQCTDMVAVCNCTTAVDIKTTINQLLNQNKTKEFIQDTLKSKYGQSMFNYAKN